MDQSEIRQTIRRQRRELDAGFRQKASERICDAISSSASFKAAARIAAFLAFDGEVDLTALISDAWGQEKQVFLPIVEGRGKPLSFAAYERDTLMIENRFGIRQPDLAHASSVDPQNLDLVLTPLVAFDTKCNRIGVGGGFYDRTFAFKKVDDARARPEMIGVAFELQKVMAIDPEAWDVRLNGVITEHAVYSV